MGPGTGEGECRMRINPSAVGYGLGRIVIVGCAVAALAACKTTSSETTGSISGEPGVVQLADTSIVTGSITPRQGTGTAAQGSSRSEALTTGSLTPPAPAAKPVKTAALGGAPTAAVKRPKTAPNRLSLVFPKNSYTLSANQTEELGALVQKAKASKRKVKVIGIARAGKGKKHAKARLDADKRAKAASMFLRVYGLQAKDMIVTTADERRSRRKKANRVDIVLQ